jgi:anti-sigma-K factor RskA
MTGSDDPYRQDLGAYLTGSLEPDEHAAMDAHVSTCRACQTELAQLAPLPALLRRVQPDVAVEPTSGPAVHNRLSDALAAATAKRRAQRRTLRVWQSAAAALAVAAGVAVLVHAPTSPAPNGRIVALRTVAGSTARGMAVLERRPWGTEIVLRLTGLPPHDPCEAWIATAGGRSPAGTWGPTATHAAEIDIATAVVAGNLSLEITTTAGDPLLGYTHPT